MKEESDISGPIETTVWATMFASLNLSDASDTEEFMRRFHSRIFSVKEAGITAKRFHDWHLAGLLPFEIPEGRKNLLSFPEFIWVRMIDRLRLVGCPLDTIRQLKEYLFKKAEINTVLSIENFSQTTESRQQLYQVLEGLQLSEAQREELRDAMESGELSLNFPGAEMPLLEMLMLYQLMSSDELGVVIYPASHFGLWTEASGESRPNLTHLYLSLTEVLRDFRVDPNMEKKIKELEPLTPQEWQVICAVRDKQAKEVKITFMTKGKERHMDLVTKREEAFDPETEKQILELLQLKGYSEVTLKTNRGELVLSEHSKRKRLQ